MIITNIAHANNYQHTRFTNKVFSNIDLNNDKIVSTEEFMYNCGIKFRKLDLDNNGVVEKFETDAFSKNNKRSHKRQGYINPHAPQFIHR